MIDIHSHILYDIEGDDGSRSETMSLGMLRQAAAAGTTHIFATPHMHRHEVVPSWSSIEERVAELQQKADAEGIPITIHTGAEVSLDTIRCSTCLAERIQITAWVVLIICWYNSRHRANRKWCLSFFMSSSFEDIY